jgi:hypothetical protein
VQNKVTAVAVSPDGRVLSWTLQNKAFIYAALRLDSQPGVHSTLPITVTGAQNNPGNGGSLDVIALSDTRYVIVSGSGNAPSPTSSQNGLYYAVLTRETS